MSEKRIAASRRAAPLAGAFALAVVALAALAILDDEEPSPAATSAPLATRPPGDAAFSPVAPDPKNPTASAVGDDAASSRREAVAAAQAATEAPSVVRTLRVRVVDAVSLAPVAGASLWLEPQAPTGAERPYVTGSARALLAARAPDAVSDANGEAAIDWRGGECFVAAATPAAFGLRPYRFQDGTTMDVRMHADTAVLAVAVDEGGVPRPQVPIALRGGQRGYLFERAAAGGAAHVTIPEFAWRVSGDLYGKASENLTLEARVLGAQPRPIALALELAHGTLHRVPAVDAAPLRVRVVHPNGQPWTAGGAVRLLQPEASPPVQLEQGVGVLPHFACAPAARIVANVRDPRYEAVAKDLPGGRVPWVESAVDVQLGAAALPGIAAGRILEPAGTPAMERQFRLARAGVHGEPRVIPTQAAVRTDAQGRFEFEVTDAHALREGVLHPVLVTDGSERADPRQRAAFALGAPDREGRYALGDLVLQEVPLLVAGVLHTADGRPASGRHFRIRFTPAGERRAGGEAHFPLVSRPDGSFAAYADAAPVQGAVLVPGPSFPRGPSPETRFFPGDDALVVTMGGAGAVVATATFADDAAPNHIQLVIHHGDDELRSSFRQGRARADGLAPGTYAVSIRSRAAPEPFVSVPDVIVRAGAETEDPRLQGLDLRAPVFAATIRVEDAEGRPLPAATVTYAGTRNAEFCDAAGVVRVTGHARAIDVLVRAPGHRERAVAVEDGATIRLERGIELRVALGRMPRAPDGLLVMAALQQDDEEARGAHALETADAVRMGLPLIGGLARLRSAQLVLASFDGTTARLVVERPGRYRVTPCLRIQGKPPHPWTAAAVDVDVGDGGASCTLECTESEWTAFVASASP